MSTTTTTTVVVVNKSQQRNSVSSSNRSSPFLVESYHTPASSSSHGSQAAAEAEDKSNRFTERQQKQQEEEEEGRYEEKLSISNATAADWHNDEDPDNTDSSNRSKFKEHCRHIGRRVLAQILKYWFLVGMAVAIGLAWAFPQVGKSNGDIQAQYTIKWGAVIVIFLLSGLGLEIRQMLHTVLRWRLHLVVQIINFILLPFVMYGIVRFYIAVGADLSSMVYQGLVIALATNTTVSSNAVMTRNANGNGSGALVNAALGNTLGIFLSPALMTVFGKDNLVFPPGERGNPDYVNVLKTLGLTVLLPLVVGQVLRYFFPRQVKYLAAKLKFSIINSLALLCIVWSVFCDGVASDAFHRMNSVDIVAIIGTDIFMYLLGCAACLFIARVPWFTEDEPRWVRKWRFSRKDAVAIMYCGATKSVSTGIPLINVMYGTQSYGTVGVLTLPLLMYHIVQLFIGNFQVHMLKQWIQKGIDEQDEQSEDDMDEATPGDNEMIHNTGGGGGRPTSPLPIYTPRRRQAPTDTDRLPSPR